MILTDKGVLKLMQRIKSFIASQLNTKAASVHTHTLSEIDDLSSLQMGGGYTKSEVDTLLTGKADTSHTHTKSQITDFPTIPSKTSDLTNDLGFISSEIDSSGDDWIRFKGGLQICWGERSTSGGSIVITYPKAFYAGYSVGVGVSGQSQNLRLIGWGGTNVSISDAGSNVTYIAVGRWK